MVLKNNDWKSIPFKYHRKSNEMSILGKHLIIKYINVFKCIYSIYNIIHSNNLQNQRRNNYLHNYMADLNELINQ